MSSCVVIANGVFKYSEELEQLVMNSDLIICADGGLKNALSNGIKPDTVMGDLDSVENLLSNSYDFEILKIEDQDTSDLEKVFEYCREKGITEIFLLGATGGRNDHFLYNLHLMKRYSANFRIMMIDELQIILGVGNEAIFRKSDGPVSFMGFSDAEGVSTEGFKYPLEKSELSFDGLQSLSNEILKTPAKIEIESGFLLVIAPIQHLYHVEYQ